MKKLWFRAPPFVEVSGRTSILVIIIAVFVSSLFFAGSVRLSNYSKYYYEVVGRKPLTTSVDCIAWNKTKKCPTNQARSWQKTSSSECPQYFRWIHEDLRHWKSTGITHDMVAAARPTAAFRLTILDGKMYVEKFRESFQSRQLFTLWGFAQLITWYGGKLPDVELMFDTGDRPVVAAEKYEAVGSVPPPLFRYCSDNHSLDIVLPDWTFWGWAEVNIKPWRSLVKEMKESNKKLKWEEREPYAYWKGNPNVCFDRQDLAKCNLSQEFDWNVRLYSVDWEEESRRGFENTNLAKQCHHRYKIYAEGYGWSVSEKYILACNSPTLMIPSSWHDFYSRGLIPQRHYWPVRKMDKCRSLKFAVDWGNNHTTKAKAIGEGGSGYVHEELKMEHVYSYMFHLLNEYSKLFKYKPTIPANATQLCSEKMVCPADGNWRKFMAESMEKSPNDSLPCKIPPPYQPRELEEFEDRKMEAVKEVEAWEDEYWGKR